MLLERALLHSPVQWGRQAGGRRMVLLIGRSFYQSDASNETMVYNEGCHSENRGSNVGFVIPPANTAPLQSLPQCLTILDLQQADREEAHQC